MLAASYGQVRLIQSGCGRKSGLQARCLFDWITFLAVSDRRVAISAILEVEGTVVQKVNQVRAKKRMTTLDASPSPKQKRVKTATDN